MTCLSSAQQGEVAQFLSHIFTVAQFFFLMLCIAFSHEHSPGNTCFLFILNIFLPDLLLVLRFRILSANLIICNWIIYTVICWTNHKWWRLSRSALSSELSNGFPQGCIPGLYPYNMKAARFLAWESISMLKVEGHLVKLLGVHIGNGLSWTTHNPVIMKDIYTHQKRIKRRIF